MKLTSTAFAHGELIPRKYTCDAEDISPPLAWTDPPQGTQSFALIVIDPNASSWVHWVYYNIPAETRSLPEAVPTDAELADGSRQGRNDRRDLGYQGPCPQGTHRYYFTLYALDTVLDLAPRATKQQLMQAMEGHVLAEAKLAGNYSRPFN